MRIVLGRVVVLIEQFCYQGGLNKLFMAMAYLEKCSGSF